MEIIKSCKPALSLFYRGFRVPSPCILVVRDSRNNISLIDYSKTFVQDTEIAETLNTYFEYAVSSLGISEPKEIITRT